jgi:hypothetical protein
MQLDLLSNLNLSIKTEHNTKWVWDIVRKKWIQLTPEEYVRQALIHYFVAQMAYPIGLMAVEKQIKYAGLIKRYDLIVFNRDQEPWLLVECKAPEVNIDQKTLHQLLQYHSQLPCPYWLMSNGIETHCADAQDIQHIQWMNHLPIFKG